MKKFLIDGISEGFSPKGIFCAISFYSRFKKEKQVSSTKRPKFFSNHLLDI